MKPLLLALPLAVALTVSAQDAAVPPADAQQPFTLRANANIVQIPTTVEVKGKVLYGLTADNFQVEDNGVPQQVTMDEDTDAMGLSLVVLLQCSRSAAVEYSRMEALPQLVDGLVGDAPHEIALVRYGSHPELVQPFSRDMTQVAASMAHMGPCEDSKAATMDAVSYAASILANRRDRFRHVILLISETRDHGSTVRESHVIEQLGRTNTVVESVSYSPAATDAYESVSKFQMGNEGLIGLLKSVVQALRQNAPKTLAHMSGGQYINFAKRKGFEDGIGLLTNRVHNYYLLSFRVPSNAPDGLHALRVTVPEYRDAHIFARENYWSGPKHAPDVQ